jgi:hypothetical protein
MAESKARALFESRYGPLGSGGQELTIAGVVYSLPELLVRLGLDFGDSRAIDALRLPDGRYVVRYFDAEDQRAVAHEFDADFRFLGETRVHIAEWIGEQACFDWLQRVRVRCPADL